MNRLAERAIDRLKPQIEEIARTQGIAAGTADFQAERDRLFAATSWVRERHEDRVALGIDDTANWTAWLAYWQSLRDMPDAPDFDASAPIWPEAPA